MVACPKPKPHKHHKPKNNPKPTAEDRCEYPGCGQGNAHSHEVFFGSLRQMSMRYGLKKRLCYTHHEGDLGPHQCREYDLKLKREAQAQFEQEHSRELFMEIFGRNYLEVNTPDRQQGYKGGDIDEFYPRRI